MKYMSITPFCIIKLIIRFINSVETLNLDFGWTISGRTYSPTSATDNAVDGWKYVQLLRQPEGGSITQSDAEMITSSTYSGESVMTVDLGTSYFISAVSLHMTKDYAIPGEKKVVVSTNAAEDNVDTADFCMEQRVLIYYFAVCLNNVLLT